MTTAPLDVKVVYDASATRGRRGTVVTRTGVAPSRWLIVGVINVVTSGVLCYGAWWRVDSEILYPGIVMHSTIPGVNLNLLSANMIPKKRTPHAKPLTKSSDQEPARAALPASKASPATASTAGSRTVDARTVQLWGAAYTWLALATLASCALSLSSGSLIGRWRGDSIRSVGMILTGGAVLGLGLSVYTVFNKYGMEYPTGHLRLTMAGLGALCFCVGLSIAGRVRGLARFAGGTVILSAIGSVVGLYLWSRIDAVPPEQATLTYLLIVFAIHSAWGWILWVVAPRLPR